MKTAVIPQVRVEPEFRAELEASLFDGETLSEFVESAVRDAATRRRAQAEFIARGLASRDEARGTGVYFTIEQVDEKLSTMVSEARERVLPGSK